MMGGSVDDAHDMAFERSEMFWEEVEDGERDGGYICCTIARELK